MLLIGFPTRFCTSPFSSRVVFDDCALDSVDYFLAYFLLHQSNAVTQRRSPYTKKDSHAGLLRSQANELRLLFFAQLPILRHNYANTMRYVNLVSQPFDYIRYFSRAIHDQFFLLRHQQGASKLRSQHLWRAYHLSLQVLFLPCEVA